MCRFHDTLHNYPLICVFKAGLFSAVGAVSLVESYKWLSPDSGDQTVRLLQATVNLLAQEINSNNTGVSSIVAAGDEPFHRTLDVVAVNILWFGSMVICIGCAIASTLIQQWGRRYLALTQGHDPAPDRKRVRDVLLNGFNTFHMQGIRHLVGMALYTSVFLYCLGIVIFIIHIDWALAPLAASYLGLCGVLYAIVTVLQFFFLACPFSTPFTPLVFRLYHFSMYSLFLMLRLMSILSFQRSFRRRLNDKAEEHRLHAQNGLDRTVQGYITDLRRHPISNSPV